MKPAPRLLTRPGCGLCDDFLRDWQAAFPGLHLPCCDVDRDAALQARYGDTVPVLLDADGHELCRVHFDRDRCLPAARWLGGSAGGRPAAGGTAQAAE